MCYVLRQLARRTGPRSIPLTTKVELENARVRVLHITVEPKPKLELRLEDAVGSAPRL